MNPDLNYGDLLDNAGEDVADYVIIEHGDSRGEGKAVIDPDFGGYSNEGVESVSDLAVEISDLISNGYNGVTQYNVVGADEKDVGDALEEVIHDLTPERPSRDNMFTGTAIE